MNELRPFKQVTARIILIYPILIFLSSLILFSCEKKDNNDALSHFVSENSRYDIDEFILNKVAEHRITMLSDNGHGQPIYMHRVISLLNHWLAKFNHDSTISKQIPQDIILFLEASKKDINNMNKYIETNDILDILNMDIISSENATTAELEFYYDLGFIFKRVEKYNLALDSKNKIRFTIAGPEMSISTDTCSTNDIHLFFLYERDQYAANQIITILENQPNSRALIFYGTAHLNCAKTIKRAGEFETDGYYLGHFLTEYFGEDNIYTIHQTTPSSFKYYPHIAYGGNKSYVFDNAFLRNSKLNSDNVYDFTEATITIIGIQERVRPINTLISDSMIEFLELNSKYFIDVEKNNKKMRYHSGLINYMIIISGEKYEKYMKNGCFHLDDLYQDFISRYEVGNVNIIEDVENLNILKRLIDHMADSEGEYTNWYEVLISNMIGRRPEFDTLLTSGIRAGYLWQNIQDNRKDFIIETFIHMCWLCSDEEKKEVFSILGKETGKHFNSPKEWINWWRQSRKIDG